ncbi:hypothetical protein L522_2833 [Bordetella bronchiseptica MBORD707]|nr:hypothetical protein L522_2833 [Bordetella bronchiseptica MBORD707]
MRVCVRAGFGNACPDELHRRTLRATSKDFLCCDKDSRSTARPPGRSPARRRCPGRFARMCKMRSAASAMDAHRCNSEFSGPGYARVARPGAYPSDNSKRLTARAAIPLIFPVRCIAC